MTEVDLSTLIEECRSNLMGQPINEALAWCDQRKLRIRIVAIDGHDKTALADFRADRVNVSLVDNQIAEVVGIG